MRRLLIGLALALMALAPARSQEQLTCYRDLAGHTDAELIECYTQAIARGQLSSADNLQAYYNRAATYEKTGQTDQAIADYTTLISISSFKTSPYFWRGRLYEKLGRSDDALADYRAAMAQNPDPNADTWYNGQIREGLERLGADLGK